MKELLAPAAQHFMEQHPPAPEAVAPIAYELWEQRGRVHGAALEDWATAELIVTIRTIKEQGLFSTQDGHNGKLPESFPK